METSWRDLPGVAHAAGRLLLRHWPMMLVLAFAGVGVRAGALWAAIRISDWNSFVAQLVLIASPLGYLLPIIWMLHLCRPSLSNVRELDRHHASITPTEARERRLLDVSVSVLVPFLTVYVSYQLLKQDRETFLNNAAFAEFNHFDDGTRPDFAARLGVYGIATVIAIVAISWVVRWALGRFEKRTSFVWLVALGAVVEVYYTTQVARNVDYSKRSIHDWVADRRSTHWVDSHWNSLLDHLGWFGHPIANATSWLFDVIGSLDAVVVVPIGWLTVAAVVLGHKLDAVESDAVESEATEPTPARTPSWRRRITGGLLELVADVRERWSAFFRGLKLLAAAGLVPMLTFSLLFLVVIRLPYLLSIGIRSLLGPTDTNTWLAFSPHESSFALAITMVLTACLLAAAMDWLLGARLRTLTTRPEAGGSHSAS